MGVAFTGGSRKDLFSVSRIDLILSGSTVDLDQFAEIVSFVNGIDLANDNAMLSAVTSIGLEINAEESRAMTAEEPITERLHHYWYLVKM